MGLRGLTERDKRGECFWGLSITLYILLACLRAACTKSRGFIEIEWVKNSNAGLPIFCVRIEYLNISLLVLFTNRSDLPQQFCQSLSDFTNSLVYKRIPCSKINCNS